MNNDKIELLKSHIEKCLSLLENLNDDTFSKKDAITVFKDIFLQTVKHMEEILNSVKEVVQEHVTYLDKRSDFLAVTVKYLMIKYEIKCVEIDLNDFSKKHGDRVGLALDFDYKKRILKTTID